MSGGINSDSGYFRGQLGYYYRSSPSQVPNQLPMHNRIPKIHYHQQQNHLANFSIRQVQNHDCNAQQYLENRAGNSRWTPRCQ
jgi:hypothetical protein